MEQVLVSNDSIINNLRRTMSKGLISSLTEKDINTLALKYFGIYENGELIGYQCPYSGKVLTNPKKIILEHIIPVSRGGGTVLFNCIPTSEEVNKVSEKGTDHLISWWTNSKYWNKDAPERLEKVIQYMLEAYEHFLDGSNENNYDDEMMDNDIYDTSDDLESDLSTTQEEQQRNKKNTIITYYQFIDDALNILKKYMNVDRYQSQLQNLINKDTFKEIERATLVQNCLKNIIKDKLEIEDRSELTYISYFNIIKLTESLNSYSDGDIYKELENRIDNIDKVLNKNNLSLFSFLTDKNSLHYLYKKELTNDDINQLIQNINICVEDKFNVLIDYVTENKGMLPSTIDKDEKIKKLGNFRCSIQVINKESKKFSTSLTKEQLEYLHNSGVDSLREIYKTMLNKAIDNNIKIAYVDEQMKEKILEFKKRSQDISLEERIKLEEKYSDVVVINRQFHQFISYVLKNKGILPSTIDKDDEVKKIGDFRKRIQFVDKQTKNFRTSLTKEQLEYLHNSEYESLREIYKTILNKAIDNNIEIAYVDEQMKEKILEFKKRSKGISLEEQIKLEEEYRDVIVIDSQFHQFISYVLEHEGILPSTMNKDDEVKKLGNFRSSIQSIDKRIKNFRTLLTKEQLEYLHNSEYESLREIYKTILNKVIDNNIEIAYVDEQMKEKILEFKKRSKGISLEEQIKLEEEYRDVIVIDSQFHQFISYVLEHEGILPSTMNKDDEVKKIGYFRKGIQSIDKRIKNFRTSLTKEQLEYLHNSEYESLRTIYYNIIEKARQINYLPYLEVDKELESNKKGRAA